MCVCVCVIFFYIFILSPVACPALKYFSTFSRKKACFSKNLKDKMLVLISSIIFSETFLIIRRTV